MPVPKRIVRNAASSVAQVAVSGITLFILYRQLLSILGAPRLGIWSLVLAAASASRVSDLGFSVGVVRFVAQQLARKDVAQARAVAETALISSAAVVAAVSLLLAPALAWAMPRFIEAEALPDALALLPWALFSLWLSVLAAIGQAGIDGCQRVDLRGLVVSGGHLLFFALAMVLVRPFGLLGLAWAQVAQGVATAVASWALLRRQLAGLPWLPRHFDRLQFGVMIRYGASFQAATVATFFLDPITKVLLSRFGGLGSVGYYEMATRLISQLRNLLATANQVLVPVFAGLRETSAEAARTMYLQSYRLMVFLGVPFFSLVAAAIPPISWLLIGHFEPAFVHPAELLAIGWGLNTLTAPAYFANMGSGYLRWNTLSHVLTALLNLALGWFLGWWLGGLGVVLGWNVALLLGSALVPVAFHRSHRLALRELLPRESRFLAAVSVALAGLAWVAAGGLAAWPPLAAVAWAALATFVLGLAVPVWQHPLRARLLEAVQAAAPAQDKPA